MCTHEEGCTYKKESEMQTNVAINGYPFERQMHLDLSRFPELQLLGHSCSLYLCAHIVWNLYHHLLSPCCSPLLLPYVVVAALGKRMSEDNRKILGLVGLKK